MSSNNEATIQGSRGLPGAPGTNGNVGPQGPPGPPNDFWRSAVDTTLPDGVTDTTDAIQHDGRVGIGVGDGTADPVAVLDVANGARSGVDTRGAATVAFFTGALPSLGSGVAAVATPAVAGVEFKHSNQSQGIGIAFDGFYATGSNPNQDFNLMQRGTGQFFKRWQALNGGFAYYNDILPFALPAGQGLNRRLWVNGALEAQDAILRQGIAGVPGTLLGLERFFQLKDDGGTLRNALMLRPSRTQPSVFSAFFDQNALNDMKVVLWGDGTLANSFGFGIRGSELVSWLPNAGNSFRWRRGSDAAIMFEVTGAGRVIAPLLPGPFASDAAAGVGGLASGTLYKQTAGATTIVAVKL